MAPKFSLIDLLGDIGTIVIVDVGALPITKEPPRYADLVETGRTRVVGFEPNVAECEKLNRTYGDAHEFHPYFIGDGRDATFYETTWPPTGSLYEPNAPLLQKFQTAHELATLTAKHAVKTHRLDDIDGLDDVDFLDIDVQGAELDVFKGAPNCLARAVLIQTEVEFVETYVDQPLFADIDSHLRAVGYQFHTFLGFGKRCFKPMAVKADATQGLNQILWADAVYVRDFMRFDQLGRDKLLKLAVLLHEIYRSYDLAMQVLAEVDRREGTQLANRYAMLITGTPQG